MSTPRDDHDAPRPLRARTAIGAFFMRIAEAPRAPDTQTFLPARERMCAGEVWRVAAFAGGWLFAATGCLLPWHGPGWWLVAHVALSLALWPLAWFAALQLAILVPGALAALLERAGVLSRDEGRLLIDGGVLVAFSTLALVLVARGGVVCTLAGMVWLLVLASEGMLRGVLLAKKLLSGKQSGGF